MELGPVVVELKSEKGEVKIYRPRPEVVVVVSSGFLTLALWPGQEAFYAKCFAEVPKLHVYRDASEVRTIETAYREKQQQFAKVNRPKIAEVVFHQKSALIAMAINAGALFSGAPISAVNRDVFEKKLGALLMPKAA